MQLIACLFGFFSVAFFYGIFLAIWISVGYFGKVKHKKFWFLLSIPIFAIASMFFLLYQYRPEAVYERAFGFPPATDVAIHNSQNWYFADAGAIYLKFTANPGTINQIVRKGLIQKSQVIKPCISTNASPPDWWEPKLNATTVLYTGYFEESGITKNDYFRQQDFAGESECLYYDSVSQLAYYMFLGID